MKRIVVVLAVLAAAAAHAEEKKKKPANVSIGADGSVQVLDGEGNAVNVGADGSIDVKASDGSTGKMEGAAATGAPVTGTTISDHKTKGTHDCKGGPISISGNNNVYTFTNCSKVSLLGNSNEVTLGAGAESVEFLGNYNKARVATLQSASIMGNYNKLTWTKGAGGKDPRISAPGRYNKIFHE